MQSKIAMKLHLTPVRLALITKNKTNTVSMNVRERDPHSLQVEMLAGPAILEINLELLKQLVIELPYYPTIHFLASTPNFKKRKKKPLLRKDIYIPIFIASLFNNSQYLKLYPSTDGIIKQHSVYTMEYYSP